RGRAMTGSTHSSRRARRTTPPPKPTSAVMAEVARAATPTRTSSIGLTAHLSTTCITSAGRRDGGDRLEEVLGGRGERGGGLGALERRERGDGRVDLASRIDERGVDASRRPHQLARSVDLRPVE